jgi:phytoene dehydrogenase-like protein
MTNGIKKHGGEVRTEQTVSKILIENNQAIGIELMDGKKIMAKTIISNADPSVTYLKLVGKENISAGLVKKLAKTKYSVTSLILFLTLDMDATKAGLDSGNIWLLKDNDIDRVYTEMIAKDVLAGDKFPAAFISCTTLKDPTSFNGRYHNFEIVTFIDYESFSAFNKKEDHHGDMYTKYKEKIIQKILNNVEQVIPGAKQHIAQVQLGTPKTNEYYIHSTNGNVYGTEKTLKQIGPFSYKNKSEIDNLFLCGASTLSHGVGGATYSGVETAAQILKCKSKDLLINDKDQSIRIYDAEDRSGWPDWIFTKMADKKRRFKEINK